MRLCVCGLVVCVHVRSVCCCCHVHSAGGGTCAAVCSGELHGWASLQSTVGGPSGFPLPRVQPHLGPGLARTAEERQGRQDGCSFGPSEAGQGAGELVGEENPPPTQNKRICGRALRPPPPPWPLLQRGSSNEEETFSFPRWDAEGWHFCIFQ